MQIAYKNDAEAKVNRRFLERSGGRVAPRLRYLRAARHGRKRHQ